MHFMQQSIAAQRCACFYLSLAVQYTKQKMCWKLNKDITFVQLFHLTLHTPLQ